MRSVACLPFYVCVVPLANFVVMDETRRGSHRGWCQITFDASLGTQHPARSFEKGQKRLLVIN